MRKTEHGKVSPVVLLAFLRNGAATSSSRRAATTTWRSPSTGASSWRRFGAPAAARARLRPAGRGTRRGARLRRRRAGRRQSSPNASPRRARRRSGRSRRAASRSCRDRGGARPRRRHVSDHDEADVVRRRREGEDRASHAVADLRRRPVLHLVEETLQLLVHEAPVRVLRETVGREEQHVAGSQEVDLVDRRAALRGAGSAPPRLRIPAPARAGNIPMSASETVRSAPNRMIRRYSREKTRAGVAGRHVTEPAPIRDLAVDHGHELLDVGRLVEPRLDVLDELRRDLAGHLELVVRAQQERLVQHRRHERVRDPVSRDVRQQDSCAMPVALELRDHLRPARRGRSRDERVQVVPSLEVDVDDVVAAQRSVSGIETPAMSTPSSRGPRPARASGAGRSS